MHTEHRNGLNNNIEILFAGVHVPGPIIRVHTNVAYVTNKPVRYVDILLRLEVNSELINITLHTSKESEATYTELESVQYHSVGPDNFESRGSYIYNNNEQQGSDYY